MDGKWPPMGMEYFFLGEENVLTLDYSDSVTLWINSVGKLYHI